MDRFKITKDGAGWRIIDTRTGILHSARIDDKARAARQANTMNARLAAKGAK